MRLLFLFSAWCFMSIPCFSQDYFQLQFKHIGQKQGLPNRIVKTVIQDHTGFYWFGTDNGIYRFDGENFVALVDIHPTFEILKDVSINCLELEEEKLWIGTSKGLFIFDVTQGTLKSISLIKVVGPQEYRQQNVIRIFLKGKRKYVITRNHTLYLMKGYQAVRLFNARDSMDVMPTDIFDIYEKQDSTILLGTRLGVFQLELNSNSKKCTYKLLSKTKSIRKFFTCQDTLHGMSSFEFIYRSCPQNSRFKKHDYEVLKKETGKDPKIIISSLALNDSTLMLACYSGEIYCWNMYANKLHKMNNKENNYTGSRMVFSITKDSHGNLWFATNNGVYVAKQPSSIFQPILRESKETEMKSVRDLFRLDSTHILISTYKGIYLYNKWDKEVHVLSQNVKHNINTVLNELMVYQFIQDKKGVIYACSENSGVFKVNYIDKKNYTIEFEQLPFYMENSEFVHVRTFKFRDDKVAIGVGRDGVCSFDIHSQQKAKALNFEAEISNVNAFNMLLDSNLLWVASEDGLSLFWEQDDQWVKKKTVIYDAVYDFKIIHSKIMAVGPLGLYIKGQSGVQHFTMTDGLPHNKVYALLPDAKGNLWLSTDNGLSYFKTKEKQFQNFHEGNGLVFNEFNFGASLQMEENEFYFGGINGLVCVKGTPKEIVQNKDNIIFSEVSMYDEEEKQVRKYYANLKNASLTFHPKNKFIAYYFAVNNYYAKENITYQYKLEGYDKQWNHSGKTGYCRYNALPAGEYKLNVRALTHAGHWIYAENVLPLKVEEWFYRTWWFYISCSLFLAGVIVLISRSRLLQKLKLQKLRTQIASDLHDELGGILTSIGVSSNLQASLSSDAESKVHFEKINQLTQKAISGVSDVVWSVDSRNDNMLALKNRLQEFAANLLDSKGISFHLVLDNEVVAYSIPLLVRQNVYLICKEIIHNCAKHCKGDKLEMRILKQGNYLLLETKDNGLEMKQSGRLTGQGLKNIKMRAKRINASCTMEFKNGFKVSLKIPVKDK